MSKKLTLSLSDSDGEFIMNKKIYDLLAVALLDDFISKIVEDNLKMIKENMD